jgi:hypothetical protein
MKGAVYYHVRHTYGHSVYWGEIAAAALAGAYPCPWCGGETGMKTPDNAAVLNCGSSAALRNCRLTEQSPQRALTI